MISFFNLSIDLFCLSNSEGTLLEVSPSFEKVLGYKLEDIKGRSYLDFVHPDDLEKTIEIAKTYKQDLVEEFVNRYRCKDGSYKCLSWKSVSDSDGIIYAVARDVTREKKLSDEIERTNQILKETSHIAKVGGWELIVETGELNWTDETFHLLEVEKVDGSKPHLPDGMSMFFGESIEKMEKAMQEILQNGTPYSLEVLVKTANGKVNWFYTNGKAHYENGKIIRLTGTIQNIHERKMIEQKLLEESQKNLVQSRLASIGELAAGVGHEINNPLVIGHGNLLRLKKNKSLNEEDRKSIKNIEHALERIETITKGLRNFSRFCDEKEVIDVCLVVKDTISFVEKIYQNEGITITLSCDLEKSFIKANRAEIQQVVLNMLSNAKDATEGNMKRLINLSVDEVDGNVQIIVEDNGCGIKKELQNKIFNSFYTSKEFDKGTGIGLSICDQIIQNHGGEIKVESELGRGCKFYIQIPSTKEKYLFSSKPVRSEDKLNKTDMKILIVEDEKGIRELLAELLSLSGCHVDYAENGVTALKMIEVGAYDLVISDIKMPKMNGKELLSKIRENKTITQPKVILITGGADLKEIESISYQCDGSLSKPFQDSELIESINKIFS
jgi:PAS domain S-box-containing protein